MAAFCAPPPTASQLRRLSKNVISIARATPKETGANDTSCANGKGRYSAIFARCTGIGAGYAAIAGFTPKSPEGGLV